MSQGTVLFSPVPSSDCRGRTPPAPGMLSLAVGGRTSFFFIYLIIIIFKKSQPASGVTEVVGLAEERLGVAELKLKLVSWLATAFCGAQRRVMCDACLLHAI